MKDDTPIPKDQNHQSIAEDPKIELEGDSNSEQNNESEGHHSWIKRKIPYEDWFMVKEAERVLKTKLIKTISKEI